MTEEQAAIPNIIDFTQEKKKKKKVVKDKTKEEGKVGKYHESIYPIFCLFFTFSNKNSAYRQSRQGG